MHPFSSEPALTQTRKNAYHGIPLVSQGSRSTTLAGQAHRPHIPGILYQPINEKSVVLPGSKARKSSQLRLPIILPVTQDMYPPS